MLSESENPGRRAPFHPEAAGRGIARGAGDLRRGARRRAAATARLAEFIWSLRGGEGGSIRTPNLAIERLALKNLSGSTRLKRFCTVTDLTFAFVRPI